MSKYRAIISYPEIVNREGLMLQKGMNFRIKPRYSILLMSVRKGAPYNDIWHEDTSLLEYEGHDEPRRGTFDPKTIDQPMKLPGGGLTENGKFYEAAKSYQTGKGPPETVQVYEKINQGVWCDRGRYELVDASIISDGTRKVFKFFLRPIRASNSTEPVLKQTRIIPTSVKVEVWKRDQGRCVLCGSDKNLHFDHDVPYSKGGSSLTAKNVRLLCAKHNLAKSDNILSLGPFAIGILSAFIGRSA